jgi:single-strand DNA-binding protein
MNFNQVILIGNLTRDPQISYLPSQTAVVDIGLATNRRWKNDAGEKREEVCFVDCQAFGKSAENLNKYCKKGQPLMIIGRLTYSTWTGQDGQKKSRLKVTIEKFNFVPDGKKSEADNAQEPLPDNPNNSNDVGGDDIPFE